MTLDCCVSIISLSLSHTHCVWGCSEVSIALFWFMIMILILLFIFIFFNVSVIWVLLVWPESSEKLLLLILFDDFLEILASFLVDLWRFFFLSPFFWYAYIIHRSLSVNRVIWWLNRVIFRLILIGCWLLSSELWGE